MACEFPSGVYNIQLGKTFIEKQQVNQNYYTLRFHSKLDPALHSRKTHFRQDNDAYITEWISDDNVVSYEGMPSNVQDMDCLLVYDEDTKTFTLERPTMKLTMKKVRKKKPTGPPGKPGRKPKSATKQSQDTPMDDSFDVDFLRDMDEILNSDDNDDEAEDSDDSEGFETVDTPNASSSQDATQRSKKPVAAAPIAKTPSSSSSTTALTPTMTVSTPGTVQSPSKRRRKLKMASAPIRRLDASPPTPAPATFSNNQPPLALPGAMPHHQLGQKRPRIAGKSNSLAAMAARSRANMSDSGSSSDDDDSSSSGSDESSSGSGSSSEDDMDTLAEDIARGLSEDEALAASPYMNSTSSLPGTTPNYLKPSPNRSHALTPTMNRAGPTSLRDLLGKCQEPKLPDEKSSHFPLDGQHRDDEADDMSSSDDGEIL
ncbi:hypothetical protein DM01DRAFT_1403248 [Hesseltinella vesiculosa]|uniref:Transcription elongation factor Eaf N-terminal domain-containing protein n=1 Tax=Hesseltinella vesiculosa TaxID=101127 RepID=A0A1X2GXI9_9FUNG|nr:hypothetical protein DM01DRAFT_1403248 [Hesseltinella vesiculosa]